MRTVVRLYQRKFVGQSRARGITPLALPPDARCVRSRTHRPRPCGILEGKGNHAMPSRHSTLPAVADTCAEPGLDDLMVAEVLQGTGNDLRGFTWWGPGSQFTTFLAPNTSSPDQMSGGTCVNRPEIGLPCAATPTTNLMSARSRHSGGVQSANCDGSVRFVQNNINIDIWRALSTRRGAEVIGNF